MSAKEYPFGVAPRDPFDAAHCPACRAQVGPRQQSCRNCFATYDLRAAEAELFAQPRARAARSVQLGVAMLGILALLAAFTLPGAAAPLGISGVTAVVGGVLGWWLFPRMPALFAIASAVLLVGAAVAVLVFGLQGQEDLQLPRRIIGGVLTIALVLFSGLAMTGLGGVGVGRTKRKLHAVARPVALETEGYR